VPFAGNTIAKQRSTSNNSLNVIHTLPRVDDASIDRPAIESRITTIQSIRGSEGTTLEPFVNLPRNPTRAVKIGSVTIGGGNPIAVQSMCATHTQDIDATVGQVNDLHAAGADVVRIAVDSKKDADALAEIRRRTQANLVIDLQENYRMAELVAPHVDKVRYNPGHLYHQEREKPWQDKVKYLADVAAGNDCALRVGVNCGSVDPAKAEKYGEEDSISPMIESALDHCALLDSIGFTRYCVSLKDSDPAKVVEVNRRFAQERPDVPLHLGVTEAGLPPDGIIKTRIAFEQLISQGIGDTIRVSLTVPNPRKKEEIEAGRQILADIAAGRVRSVVKFNRDALNIISCPSCSRVENEAFIELAQQVKEMSSYAKDYAVTIAVMGCRVNGPGETDDADLGLWCAPNFVNLKRGSEELGAFPYNEILPRLRQELDLLIRQKFPQTQSS
jgi:(E)-4-hydroxy-3-methylbut-2-enyl-diphosphate synthase